MITVHIRKQGGAAIITIPADILKLLNINVGEELALDVTKEGFIARPLEKKLRKRYTVDELLSGVSKKEMDKLNKETAWSRKGKSVGREIT